MTGIVLVYQVLFAYLLIGLVHAALLMIMLREVDKSGEDSKIPPMARRMIQSWLDENDRQGGRYLALAVLAEIALWPMNYLQG